MSPIPPHIHPMRPVKCRGFTLIELLTVIAIIGILAAIIIPTVGRVRESAKAAQCTSNLRQIGLAVFAYANDNRGFLPGPVYSQVAARVNTNKGPTEAPYLAVRLLPYLNDPRQKGARTYEVFVCPSWDLQKTDESGTIYMLASGVGEAGVNRLSNVFGVPDSTPEKNPRQLSEVQRVVSPGQTRMMFEIDLESRDVEDLGLSASVKAKLLDKPFHGSFRNALHFDGSVQRHKAAR